MNPVWKEMYSQYSIRNHSHAGEGVEKRESSYTTGGNINWLHSHYGEQCGSPLKNLKQNYHMIQQSHSWAYIWRKP